MTQSYFPYDSRQIANWFVRRSDKDEISLSIMKLIKLVYIAHGWCLAALDRPLIIDEVQAWDYGPVIPDIYYTFRTKDIYTMSVFSMKERDLDSITEQLLNEVWELYKNNTALQLSNLTHIVGGPWERTYDPTFRFKKIPNQLISSHYKEKIRAARNGGRRFSNYSRSRREFREAEIKG